jgi:hypothetical protein
VNSIDVIDITLGINDRASSVASPIASCFCQDGVKSAADGFSFNALVELLVDVLLDGSRNSGADGFINKLTVRQS